MEILNLENMLLKTNEIEIMASWRRMSLRDASYYK